jgi:alanine racemase
MTLESTVIALREVAPGERVGYGGIWHAQRPSRLAIVAAGYGDGLPRSIPAGAPVLIAGERAQLAGRVSMDMIAVDITNLPPVAVGDRVELWGARLPVEELAAAAGTIAYELLCAVSQRVPIELV